MHYTSPENIHKVIDPLFLDGLKAEFKAIRDDEETTPRQKRNRYAKFHGKLCGLTFLDPACGSGNFLTETYLCLRKLEDAVLGELRRGQTRIELGESEDEGMRVSLSQFFGIEINDFAVTVAESALWISRLKANGEASMQLSVEDDFPLNESAHIECANALTTDWNDVLPAAECSYIIGNPPFVGSSWCTKEQKGEIVELFGKGVRRSSSIDYVSGWYYKACEMMQVNPELKAALVSTNSITFGEQVYPIWHTLMERFGVHIDFAHRTFAWDNEASDKAHVHCVIIGFSCGHKRDAVKRIFRADGEAVVAGNINPYLIDAPNVIVASRSSQISGAPRITLGSKPVDGGNYIFTPQEKASFLASEPQAEPLFHPFLGSSELINGRERYCIYAGNVDKAELLKMPLVQERVRAVRELRAKSTSPATRKSAETPEKFFFECMPTEPFIAIPEVSSERRRYIPIALLDPSIMASNKLLVVQNAGLYEFGVLTSQMHNAWMRVVTGRLKSDYQYSNAVVYNNFVWPDSESPLLRHSERGEESPASRPGRSFAGAQDDEQGIRSEIEDCAQAILDTRELYPDASLATLYDPDKMPDDLKAAHAALDAAVEAAYGVNFNGDEERIVAHLFKLYAEATKEH